MILIIHTGNVTNNNIHMYFQEKIYLLVFSKCFRDVFFSKNNLFITFRTSKFGDVM